MELVCDFRAIYRRSWWRMVERGDPDEVEALVDGLMLRSDSLWRATVFSNNPPPAGEDSRALGWHGWDQATALLLEICNMLAGKRHLDPPPTTPAWEQPPTPAGADGMSSEIGMLQQLRLR